MKVAVHLHLYYLEQLPELLAGLENLNRAGITWDLFVTMPAAVCSFSATGKNAAHLSAEIISPAAETDARTDSFAAADAQIRAAFPAAVIWRPENRGYDVGPFIDFLHRVRLDEYDYILKIHTKRRQHGEYCCFNGIRFHTAAWSKILLDALLETPEIVRRNFALLENETDIGMVGNGFCLTGEAGTYKMLEASIKNEAEKMHLPPIENFNFIAGTMFIVRARLLQPFLRYGINDFEAADSQIRDYTLAHVLERLFGMSVTARGYKIYGVKYKEYYTERLVAGITRFLFQHKTTKSGKKILKICRLPVWVSQDYLPVYPVVREFSNAPLRHRRLAVYAAWDGNGYVDKADLYYIRALKEVADNVIYVCDNGLVAGEAEKISREVCCILAASHGEYDFGSYKRGFAYAQNHGLLDGVEELIFCNDSCYAPVHPFKPVFDEMQGKECDFWGITENTEFSRHIQSYFMVFRPQVFQSKVFNQFITGITAQKTVQDVIENYEVGLSEKLTADGFKAISWFSEHNGSVLPVWNDKNLTVHPVFLIKHGTPVIKKKSFDPDSGYLEKSPLFTRYCAVRFNRKLKNALPPFSAIVWQHFRYKAKRFLFQKKITKSGKTIIKICKIPVFAKHSNVPVSGGEIRA